MAKGTTKLSQSYVLDSINSITMSYDNKIYNLLDKDICLCKNEVYFKGMLGGPDQLNGQNAKPVTCNCKKSRCLKLYCDCFKNGLQCGTDCKCEDCRNNDQYKTVKQKTIQEIKQRNNTAFLSIVQPQEVRLAPHPALLTHRLPLSHDGVACACACGRVGGRMHVSENVHPPPRAGVR